jgi:prophage regulatory protein
MTRQILRRPDVSRRTGLGRSALYAYIREGHFPRPVKLGPRAVGWLEEEVDSWIADRAEERGAGGKGAMSKATNSHSTVRLHNGGIQ